MAKDYYDILGVSKSASQDEIKKAYRRLALQHHPDRGGGDTDRFKEVNEAYQILSDPQKRQQYDSFGSAGFSGQGRPGWDFSGYSARGGPDSGWDFGDLGGRGFEYSFGGLGGLGDIFGDLFSQAFSTVQAGVEITPAQAVLGDHLEVSVGNEKIDFDIPPGTQDGTQFRFRGKGRKTRRGEKGDLILSVRIKMPQRVNEKQKELWQKLRDLDQSKRSWWGR